MATSPLSESQERSARAHTASTVEAANHSNSRSSPRHSAMRARSLRFLTSFGMAPASSARHDFQQPRDVRGEILLTQPERIDRAQAGVRSERDDGGTVGDAV